MSFTLPNSLDFLKDHTSPTTIGVGITELPKRNIFQSIGDYFASKSGNKRISFVVINQNEITFIHFRGEEVLNTQTIPNEKIEQMSFAKGKTEDGIIALVNVSFEKIISIDKKGNKKTEMQYFKVLPCYFGLNLKQLSSPSDIQWAIENLKNMENR